MPAPLVPFARELRNTGMWALFTQHPSSWGANSHWLKVWCVLRGSLRSHLRMREVVQRRLNLRRFRNSPERHNRPPEVRARTSAEGIVRFFEGEPRRTHPKQASMLRTVSELGGASHNTPHPCVGVVRPSRLAALAPQDEGRCATARLNLRRVRNSPERHYRCGRGTSMWRRRSRAGRSRLRGRRSGVRVRRWSCTKGGARYRGLTGSLPSVSNNTVRSLPFERPMHWMVALPI